MQFFHLALDQISYLLAVSLYHLFQCVNPAGPISGVFVIFTSLQHIQESVLLHGNTRFRQVDKVCPDFHPLLQRVLRSRLIDSCVSVTDDCNQDI